jgi:phosphoadenosine phosphosulfate reductase
VSTATVDSGRLEELEEASQRLEGAKPWEILGWAIERYFPKLTMATAFGPEGCAILHMIAGIEPRVRVFNLDTGYQFAETLRLRDRIAEELGIEVEMVRHELDVRAYEAAHGGPVYSHDPDRCCRDRKLMPMRAAIVGYDAWISSIRADQSTHRARAAVVGFDAKFGLVKVNPLLCWTHRDVWAYLAAHNVPYNPLHDHGYPSIGCWPCTRAVQAGETDERAGRWAGQAKTECGLHSLDSSQL